jgi:hypothetical protein
MILCEAARRGLHAFGVGDVAHDRRGCDIGVVVTSLVTGIVAAEIVGGVLLGSLDCTGQKAATQRGEGNETDPEFL